ncbi:MAG: DUF4160 domain-containing protein [Deltaproteobacteria bacterium]|jgi:hypothetical protein|uniref:DUF4160 domain-containing protein n=1 Tax=Candidatus Acidulodesulfobacterium acidiphilum TaxID=2597224 RepID=A0A520XC90_9DELT|nr:DUF4160 domain-containing protein [Deltaproteobacteria bacterium]MCL6120316.1 DUF4160 domain-containing protein [Deltaproteobacteria bacterium]MDA8299477.1 DUF4160 domain-containing protein [Deltaproteobacteria bacterium]RZV38817.1 MAG: DUF4160 domain-containing protein [Candidatus Acidulodesulfobacterium acidiphilum]
MPEISRFFGIIISIFYDDHNPPHFHARYGDYDALIKIEDFAVIKGHLPPRALGLVVEWANIHKNELMENWKMAVENKSLFQIEPLK